MNKNTLIITFFSIIFFASPVIKSSDDSRGDVWHQMPSDIKIVEYDVLAENEVSDRHDQSVLDIYNGVFKERWSDKDITLDQIQHTTLGGKWINLGFRIPGISATPFETLNHFIANGEREKINVKNNASILRIISSLITDSLGVSAFENVLATLNLCRAHEIHLWTSPCITKEEIENRKKNIVVCPEGSRKNIIQSAFKSARKILFKAIQNDIDLFTNNINSNVFNIEKIDDQKIVISNNQIDKIKILYTLAAMTHDIHKEIFTPYDEVFKKFSCVTEIDVLKHVSPDSVTAVMGIKNRLEEIKKSAQAAEKAKMELSQIKINIEESFVS